MLLFHPNLFKINIKETHLNHNQFPEPWQAHFRLPIAFHFHFDFIWTCMYFCRWHVPHFEKMLYDQGQLAVAFAQAFQATQDRKFAKVVQDIVEYVCRDLRHPKGGFYSAEDADSYPEAGAESKKEGAFCVWTKDELEQLIPDEKVMMG